MPVLEMKRSVAHSRSRVIGERVYCPVCNVWHGTEPSESLRRTMEDADAGRNLHGPFATAKEAVEYALAYPDDEED